MEGNMSTTQLTRDSKDRELRQQTVTNVIVDGKAP